MGRIIVQGNQIVGAGNGAATISNLEPENIRSGVTIAGVTGTLSLGVESINDIDGAFTLGPNLTLDETNKILDAIGGSGGGGSSYNIANVTTAGIVRSSANAVDSIQDRLYYVGVTETGEMYVTVPWSQGAGRSYSNGNFIEVNNTTNTISLTLSSLAAEENGANASLVTTGEKYIWNNKQIPLDFNDSRILYNSTTGEVKLNLPASVTYSSLVEENGGVDESLVTTGEKYIWNHKQNALNNGSYIDLSGDTISVNLPLDLVVTNNSSNFVNSGVIFNALEDVRGVAAGKTKTYTINLASNPGFNSQNSSISSITSFTDVHGVLINTSDLNNGDGVYITDTGVPDRWFGGDGNFYLLESDNRVPETRTVNNKALSSDIVLNASDVGALADDIEYVQNINGLNGAVTLTTDNISEANDKFYINSASQNAINSISSIETNVANLQNDVANLMNARIRIINLL